MLEDGHYTSAEELLESHAEHLRARHDEDTDCRYVDTLFAHPYLGFVHHGNRPRGKSWVTMSAGSATTSWSRSARTATPSSSWAAQSPLSSAIAAAGPAVSLGGAQQALCQPQRQAVPGAERRRRLVEGAAPLHHVHALFGLGRPGDLSGRLQRIVFLPAPHGGASRAAAQQHPLGQSLSD